MPKTGDTDSETGEDSGSTDIEATKPWNSPEDVPWTLLSQDQLVDAFDAVVRPARQDADVDETARPTYEWLSNHGFRGLTYTLREHHDTPLADWWAEYFETVEEPTYDWAVEDERTRTSFQKYLEDKRTDRRDWSDSTRDTIRTRLNTYARVYKACHGTDTLVPEVANDVDETTAIDNCRETFRFMRNEGYADRTIARVHDAIRAWYEWLQDRHVVSVNPTNGADDWFNWDRSGSGDAVTLPTDHVRALVAEAATTRERMLIVALCAWGLRSGEVASLHSNQLVLDDDKPRIEFEERKNGPSTVALVYGTDLARDRVAATGDGYLFPSRRSKAGHIHRTTVADRFHALADRAGLPDIIDGEPRKPHMARRWWYDRYSSTIEDLLEHLEDIAADQGSASARVVKDDYLSAERRRELRREFMHERLTGVFDVD